jgi:hypothetical protein
VDFSTEEIREFSRSVESLKESLFLFDQTLSSLEDFDCIESTDISSVAKAQTLQDRVL